MMKKTVADSRPMYTSSDKHTTIKFNICQERFLEFYSLNFSIHQHALTLGVIMFLMLRIIFNLATVNTVPSMCFVAISV